MLNSSSAGMDNSHPALSQLQQQCAHSVLSPSQDSSVFQGATDADPQMHQPALVLPVLHGHIWELLNHSHR